MWALRTRSTRSSARCKGTEKIEKINAQLASGEETSDNGGIGLINVQNRLRLLTGEAAYVKIGGKKGCGTTVEIKFKGIGGFA